MDEECVGRAGGEKGARVLPEELLEQLQPALPRRLLGRAHPGEQRLLLRTSQWHNERPTLSYTLHVKDQTEIPKRWPRRVALHH